MLILFIGKDNKTIKYLFTFKLEIAAYQLLSFFMFILWVGLYATAYHPCYGLASLGTNKPLLPIAIGPSGATAYYMHGSAALRIDAVCLKPLHGRQLG